MLFLPIFTSIRGGAANLNNNNSSYYYNDSDYYYYIRKRREEEEEEERKKQRIRQVNINFNKDFEEYFKNQVKEIKDHITPNLFQIEPFYIEEMSDLINLIIEEEKYKEKLFNEVKKIVSENSEKNKLVKHLNIILAGPTGAGKSTLINKILNFNGEKEIKTGIGIPCTMGEPKYYESETVPLLRLADSRGIEKTNYRMKELNESIEKFIKGQLDSENPDLFIHCIWYCITGTRLEPIERDTLGELSKIYQSNSIPIIIVYTQALSKQKIEAMKNFIHDNFNFSHDFIPVLALQEIIIDNLPPINPYGIDKLKEISVLRAKEAVKSSCYEFNVQKTKREVQEIINKNKENLNIMLNNIIAEKIELISEEKTKEEICEDLNNLLVNIISKYFNLDEGKLISVQSENLIKDFVKKFVDESMPKFDALFEKYMEDKSNELANKLYTYQNNYNQSYYINNKKNLEQFKNEKRNDLIEETNKKSKMYFYKNLIKFICSLCVEKFQEKSENIYQQILEKEEFSNLIMKLIEKDFEDIDKNLKL